MNFDLEQLSSTDWRNRKALIEALVNANDEQVAAALLKIIQDSQEELGALNTALQTLVMMDVSVFPGLKLLLKDPNPGTRMYAALALGELRDPQATSALLAALDDSDTNVRFHAIEALGKMRAKPALEALMQIVETGDFFLAFPAIEALAAIGGPVVEPLLIDLLTNDVLARPAVEALGTLGGLEMVEPLMTFLDSDQGDIIPVASSLVQAAHRYEDQSEVIDELAREAISNLTPTGYLRLIAAVQSQSTPEGAKPALIEMLRWVLTFSPATMLAKERQTIRQALAPALIQSTTRTLAIQVLSRLGPAALPDLLSQISGADLSAKRSAANALGSIGDPRAIPALVEALHEDDQDLVSIAAHAIGKIGNQQATKALIDQLGHPSALVRRNIVSAINSLGHPDLAKQISAQLNHANPLVRESAVKVLGYYGFPEVNPAILALLDDENEDVQRAVVEHLPFITDDDTAFETIVGIFKSGSTQLRSMAVKALRHFKPQAVAPLLESALQDDSLSVKIEACRAAAWLGIETLQSKIVALISDPMPPVRAAAVEALGRLEIPNLGSLLEPLLSDPEPMVTLAAVQVLSASDDPAAKSILSAALPNLEASMRQVAEEALKAAQ